MFEISTYIWGIRYGFKEKHALFPEKVRLTDPEKVKEYDQIVQHFTEEKDSWFRNCKQDFYFLLENNQYRLYSLVVSNHNDIAGRKSFIVFSLVCPTSKSLQGDVTGVLNQLKALYKEKNADETIDRNLFTAEQIKKLVQTLSIDNQIRAQKSSNSIFFIKNDDVSKVFQDYLGNEIYYIIEGSNAEMINGMPNHFKQVEYSKLNKPTNPNPYPSSGTTTPTDHTPSGALPGNIINGTGAFEEKLNKIIGACEKAKINNWKDDFSDIEKQIKQEPILEDTLKGKYNEIHSNLVQWRKFHYQVLGDNAQKRFDDLYHTLYEKSSKRERIKNIKNNLKKFDNEVDELKIAIDALKDKADVYKNFMKGNDRIKYQDLIIKKTWKPNNRKSIILIPIFIGLTLLLGVWGIILFINAKPKKVEKDNHSGEITTVKIDNSAVKDVSEDSVPLPYNGKNYRFNKTVATEDGILFSNSKYRFLGNKWERLRDTLNGHWSAPESTDIPHLLKVLVKKGKVQIITNETANSKKKTEGGKFPKPDDEIDNEIDDSSGGSDGPNDLHWINLNSLSDEQLKAKDNSGEIEAAKKSKKPSSDKGNAAKQSVIKRLKSFN